MTQGDAHYGGDGPTISTIGHGQQPADQLLAILRENRFSLVIDVRSTPWLKYAKQFNREPLEALLSQGEIDYLWLGEHLGQKPAGDQFYDAEGHALYEPISREPWFLKAIGRVEYEAEQRSTVILCVEEPPEDCHRYHLLGRVLTRRGSRVAHIRRGGRVEQQAHVGQRLGEDQPSLFAESEREVWRSPKPMRDTT